MMVQSIEYTREIKLTGRIRFAKVWLFIPTFEVEILVDVSKCGRVIRQDTRWRKVKASDKLAYIYVKVNDD